MKNLAKSELLCVASKLLEEQLEAEDLNDDEELSACGAMSEADIELLIKENTIATTQLSD